MIAGIAAGLQLNATMQAHLKRARTVLGYVAVAIGVTAGGTLVGATVVAPVVSGASLPLVPTEVRDSIKHSDLLRGVPNVLWLYLGLVAAIATVAMIAWRYRARFSVAAPQASPQAKRSTASLPEKLIVGGNANRTPRAVVALAEAGNAPADIARRTGLSLDAVSMCLTLSSLGARQ